MNRTLIIPDVHNRFEIVEKIIKHVSPDLIIFLGDIFDDFNDNPHIIVEVAHWFHHSVNQKNRIHLCGNHDLGYWFKENSNTRCSGYDQFKSMAINDIVTKEDWEKLKFFHILDGKWLLSHGGVHPTWIDRAAFKVMEISEHSLNKIENLLIHESIDAKKKFYAGNIHWFGVPGFARSQSPYYGGLLWCDWDKEFHPIRGIHQIVGHTPQWNINWTIVNENDTEKFKMFLIEVPYEALNDKNSYNVCLDSIPGSSHYAVCENNKIKIYNTSDMK